MQFCKDCGSVLNLFGTSERELCSVCIQTKLQLAPVAPLQREEDQDLLMDTQLVYENSKLVLRSKEGWELWSAPLEAETDLKTILTRARRIYEIRLRRQKK